MTLNHRTDATPEEAVLSQAIGQREIILYNDEVNTFDWVITCLMEVCKHSMEQAEQCAYLTHYKGRCGVKTGSYEELEPMCSNLLERGLSAEIA